MPVVSSGEGATGTRIRFSPVDNFCNKQGKGVRRHAGVVGKIRDGMRNLRARGGHEMVEDPRRHFGLGRRQAAHRRVQMGADDLLRPAQAVECLDPHDARTRALFLVPQSRHHQLQIRGLDPFIGTMRGDGPA